MLELTIHSDDDLLEASSSLHDAHCQKDSIRYDAGKQTLDIIFTERLGFEYESLRVQRVLLYFFVQDVPYVKSHFHLDGVKQCDIASKYRAWTEDYFSDFEHLKTGEFRLNFACGLTITLLLSGPVRGCLKDVEFMADKEGRFRISIPGVSLRKPRSFQEKLKSTE